MLPRKRPPAATEPDTDGQTIALPPSTAKTKTESAPPPRVEAKVERRIVKRELPMQPPARIAIRAPLKSEVTIEVKEVDTERRNADNIGAMLNEVLSELDVPSKARPDGDSEDDLVTKLRSAADLQKAVATLTFASEDDPEKSIATLKRATEPRAAGKESDARKPAASEVWIFREESPEPKSEEVHFSAPEFPHFETTHRMPAAAVPASVRQVIASSDSVSQLPFAQTQAAHAKLETAPLPFTPPLSAPPPAPMPAPAPSLAPPPAAVRTAQVRAPRRRAVVPWTIAFVAIALSGLILIDPSTRAQLFGQAKSLPGRSTTAEQTAAPAATTTEAAQPPTEMVNVSWQPSARNPSWSADNTPAPTAMTAATATAANTTASTAPVTTATTTPTTTTTTVAATATATAKQRPVAQSGSHPATPRPRPAAPARPKAAGGGSSAEDDEAAAAAAALAKAQLEDSLDK
jgi:hypothetical protein